MNAIVPRLLAAMSSGEDLVDAVSAFESWASARSEDLYELKDAIYRVLESDVLVNPDLTRLKRIAVVLDRVCNWLEPSVHGDIMLNIGLRFRAMENWHEAYRAFSRAETVFGGAELRSTASSARVFCVEMAWRSRDLQLMKQLLGTFDPQALRDDAAVLACHEFFNSRLLRATGRVNEAVAAATRARSLREALSRDEAQSGFVSGRSDYVAEQAYAARDAGRLDMALGTYVEARDLALQEKSLFAAALYLSEIGITWQQLGEYVRGSDILLQAAEEARRLGLTVWAERWEGFKDAGIDVDEESIGPAGRCHQAQSQMLRGVISCTEASKIFKALIRSAVKDDELETEFLARLCLADAYYLEGQYSLAASAASVAVDRARRAGNIQRQLSALTFLGDIHLKAGRRTEALRALLSATELGEGLRLESSTEVSQSILAGLSQAYDRLAFIYHLTKTGPGGDVGPQPELAFGVAQRMRATNLAMWLELQVRTQNAPIGVRAALLAYRKSEVELEETAVNAPAKVGAALERRSGAVKHFERSANISLPKIRSDFAALDPATLFQGIEPGTVYVDLLGLEPFIAVQLFDERGLRDRPIIHWSRKDRELFVSSVNVLHQSRGVGDGVGIPRELRHRARQFNPAAEAELCEAYQHFYDLVIVPLARAIQNSGAQRHAVIIPHRELSNLPFAGLERAVPGLRISIVPSATCARLLRDRAEQRSSDVLTALGDATQTLPGVSRELDLIPASSRYPRPTKDEVIAAVNGSGIVHLAAHGFFDEENPYRSGILVMPKLAPPETPFRLDPRWEILTLTELMSRTETSVCRLAVLSACYSGTPRRHAASEYTSMPSSLLIAGVRGVVAALWAVEDGAAVVLMDAFYRALKRSDSPSQALAEARIRLSCVGYEEARALVGDECYVPPRDRPFSNSVHVDAFQYVGVN